MVPKRVANSLAELANEVASTIPSAQRLSYEGISTDMSLDVAQELVQKLAHLEKLDAENERLTNALDYLLESGALSSFDDVQKAKWGLGLQVEDEQRIAALKPRYS